MRHLIILLISLVLFTACDKAKFDTGGSSDKSANGFEVVTEEEESAALGETDTPDEGIPTENCVGENCISEEDDNSEDSDCKGRNCEHDGETDSGHSCRHHDHKDGKTKDKHPNKGCKDCVVSPETIFQSDKICKDHGCGEGIQGHKIHICKWPNGDESKELTLCVAKASLKGLVRLHRQDQYYVGACSEIGQSSLELSSDKNH